MGPMTHEEVEHWSMGRPDREDQSSVAFKTFIFFLFILMAFSSIESNPISQFSFPISLIPLLTLFFHFTRQWRWSFSQPSPTLNSLLQWTKTPPSKKPPPASTPSKSSSHYSLTLTLLISTPIAKPSLTPPSPTSERPFLSSAAPLEPATPDSAVPLDSSKIYNATPIQQIPPPLDRLDSATTINFSYSAAPSSSFLTSLPGSDSEIKLQHQPSSSSFQITDLSRVSSVVSKPSSGLKRKCGSENLGSGKCAGSSGGRCHCSKKR